MAKKRKKAGKKIIHLSDAHVGYKDLSRKLGDIVTKIIFLKEPASDYVIVHTGDIVEKATKKGIYDEAKTHLNRLKDAGFTVLVIPGNHDYGTGIIANKKYVKQFKDCFYGNTNLNYPKLDIIKNIAFIGLDSMEAEIGTLDRLSAEGELGKPQLERLAEILKKDKVIKCDYRVVYLHHHPFHFILTMQLKDSDELGKILKRSKIDALLFGHNHYGKPWHGKWDIKRAYDGGTCTGKGQYPNPHRVIDLSREPGDDYDGEFSDNIPEKLN